MHKLLQSLVGRDYRCDLATWVLEYKHLFVADAKWLVSRGLDFEDYAAHLHEDGMADGLEVWLISVLLNQPINVVQYSVLARMGWISHIPP